MSKIPEFSQANRTAMLTLLDGIMEEQGLGEFWRTHFRAEQHGLAKVTLLSAYTAVKFAQAWQAAQATQTEKKDG